MIIIIVIIRSYYIDHKSSCTTSASLSHELHLKNLIFFYLFQEAIKKKLEIQKQKQELLNKQIKEQKVRLQICNQCT